MSIEFCQIENKTLIIFFLFHQLFLKKYVLNKNIKIFMK